MTIYPAIDLKGGKVVRLLQGRMEADTVYGDDPAAVARRWEAEGGRYLHVVDLDGAVKGEPANWASVREIIGAVKIPVQLGGGLRTHQQIQQALEMGVTRVVIGTKACESEEFLSAVVREFQERIVVGIDARDGFVTVKGWVESTNRPAPEFAQRINRLGVRTIIFTDVATDGMLSGPNCAAIADVCAVVSCEVIASGGVSGPDDVKRLQVLAKQCPNLKGVIIGRALYTGRVNLRQLGG